MRKFAVFIDRDGVINYDSGYFHKLEELKIFPRVGEAIKLLNSQKIPAIVVTNQSVVAKGLIGEPEVDKIHRKISEITLADGGEITKFYYCPHHPEADNPQYRLVCSCRKPGTGMFEQAAKEFDLDLGNSFVVGDSFREIEAARNLKCTSIAVECGASEFRDSKPDYKVKDLYAAVELILSQIT